MALAEMGKEVNLLKNITAFLIAWLIVWVPF